MFSLRTRVVPVLTGLIVSCLVPAHDVVAQTKPDARWTARAHLSGLITSDDQIEIVTAMDRSTFEVSGVTGVSAALEYLVAPSVGIEITALVGDLDSDLVLQTGGTTVTDDGKIQTEIFSAGANYHFRPRGRLGVYAGGFVAMAFFDDIIFDFPSSGASQKLSFDDDYGFGIQAGVDVPFRRGGHWSFSAQIRLIAIIMEGEVGGQDLDLDPINPTVGVAYRF